MRIVIFSLTLILFSVVTTESARAGYAELGFSYTYMKRYLDAVNVTETGGTTGSFSFYFWERIALELSYTQGIYTKKEREPSLILADSQRVTIQKSEVYETNFIFLLSGKDSRFQPYLKGGVAYIRKNQSIQIDGTQTYVVTPKPGFGPSAGVGLKLFLTQDLAIRLSADTIRTPVDETTFADDLTIRTGLSWML